MFSPEVLADPVELTRAMVDIESVSGNEKAITDAVHEVLERRPHLAVERFGNTLVARTRQGRDKRVVLAGHLDTVPVADNLPARVEGDRMYGCGTSDMKSGAALALHLAATVEQTRHDITYLFYDCEEVEAERNGLAKLAATEPERLTNADLAILLEPTQGLVEAGCQGTLRALVRTRGRRAHSARSWLGSNAIHAAAVVLERLSAYQASIVTIDGCLYREGLNAVRINGGIAGNVIPDECTIEVNFRFAPDRSVETATAHLQGVFDEFELEMIDWAPAAPPGLASPIAGEFLASVGRPPRAKLGWTDVARFAALGVPALNYGPGDPELAHAQGEYVEMSRIREGAEVLSTWLEIK